MTPTEDYKKGTRSLTEGKRKRGWNTVTEDSFFQEACTVVAVGASKYWGMPSRSLRIVRCPRPPGFGGRER